VGWLVCAGLADGRLVAFAVDPASFIKISLVMDGTVSTEKGHSQHLLRKLSRNVTHKKEKRGFCSRFCATEEVCATMWP